MHLGSIKTECKFFSKNHMFLVRAILDLEVISVDKSSRQAFLNAIQALMDEFQADFNDLSNIHNLVISNKFQLLLDWIKRMRTRLLMVALIATRQTSFAMEKLSKDYNVICVKIVVKHLQLKQGHSLLTQRNQPIAGISSSSISFMRNLSKISVMTV